MNDTIIGGLFVIAGVALQFVLTMLQRVVERKDRKLKGYVMDAMQDIEFLLAVESRLLDELKKAEVPVPVTKNHIRQTVRENGLNWSGQFTPGRNKDRIRRLKSL